jgi:ribulose 1,5-bisphosphate carboxylase large subunit-like protein
MQEVIEIGSDDEDDAAAKSTTTTSTIKSEGGTNNTLSVMGGSNMARPMGTKAGKQLFKEERSTASIEASLRAETLTSFAASQKSMATSLLKKN